MEEIKFNGVWWLPDNPSQKIVGVLEFTKKHGFQLSLTGVLGERTAALREKRLPIILGNVWDSDLGEKVTLKDCWVNKFSLGSLGLPREEYQVELAFVGDHLAKEEDFLFSALRVSFSGLSSWAARYSGLSHSDIPRTMDHPAGGFELKWVPSKPIAGEIPGGNIRLVLGSTRSFPSVREVTVKENLRFVITTDQPLASEVIHMKYVFPLENFLTLATGHPNALLYYSLRQPGSQEDIHVMGRRVFDDSDAATDLLPHKMIFSLADVADRAIPLIGRWFEVCERLRGVCNPYFSSLLQPNIFVDLRFLTVFQSLEVYARSRGYGDVQHPGQHLSEQFTKLLEDHWACIDSLFFENSSSGAATELMRYRNFVVHRDSGLGEQSNYGETLFWWTQRLRFLLTACLLTELGIPADEQTTFFRRNELFTHIVGLKG